MGAGKIRKNHDNFRVQHRRKVFDLAVKPRLVDLTHGCRHIGLLVGVVCFLEACKNSRNLFHIAILAPWGSLIVHSLLPC